ncbi:hypothetical protein CY34DRAFT_398567 [Suillus luteus UH-Slu-Lm8-n1]|uniref:Uncharacterized protein n=1 Tax=Suillus luteus UH-Slu-Lm8-n1 TaxID=930992 RepID=A0A0D0AVB9_9AGAM|nr:hypothetical protein CY34DRAFT_398567 [Suillus luteus UH-Slu-Lm8-n1]
MLPMCGNFHCLESTDAVDLFNMGKRFKNDCGFLSLYCELITALGKQMSTFHTFAYR